MAMQTSHKWMIIIGAIIVLGIIAYLIYRAIPKSGPPVVVPPGSTTTNPGILDTVQTAYCKIFPKSKLCGGPGKDGGVDPCATVTCNPNRPGWDMNGLYDNCCA